MNRSLSSFLQTVDRVGRFVGVLGDSTVTSISPLRTISQSVPGLEKRITNSDIDTMKYFVRIVVLLVSNTALDRINVVASLDGELPGDASQHE